MKTFLFVTVFLFVLILGGVSCSSGSSELIVGTPRVLPKVTVTARPILSESVLDDSEAMAISKGPTYYMLYVGMKVDADPFNDANLREIVSLALNRENLNKLMQQDYLIRESTVQVSVVSPGNTYSVGDQSEQESVAKAMVEQVGYGNLELLVPSSLEWAGIEISSQLSRINLSVNLKVVEDEDEFVQMLADGDMTMFLTETRGNLQQSAELLARLIHQTGPENYTNFTSKSFSAPFKAGFYRQAEEAAFKYGPSVIPLVRYKAPFLGTHVEYQIMPEFEVDEEANILVNPPRER